MSPHDSYECLASDTWTPLACLEALRLLGDKDHACLKSADEMLGQATNVEVLIEIFLKYIGHGERMPDDPFVILELLVMQAAWFGYEWHPSEFIGEVLGVLEWIHVTPAAVPASTKLC